MSRASRGIKIIYKILPEREDLHRQDLTDSINYFGSAASAIIAADFTREERRDFTIRREILWESDTASDAEVNAKEVELILSLRANDPSVGYNRWAKTHDIVNRMIRAAPSRQQPASVPTCTRRSSRR